MHEGILLQTSIAYFASARITIESESISPLLSQGHRHADVMQSQYQVSEISKKTDLYKQIDK